MTRFLPPSPDMAHLKNEAKSLLKAHQQRDAQVIPILRHVRAFSAMTDEAILDSDIKLALMQFALAMEYGFGNWHALRQAVLSVNPMPGYCEQVQGKALLLPDPPVGHLHVNRFVSALTMMLEYAGVVTDVTELAGDSGMAFIFQADALHHPFKNNLRQLDIGWWPCDSWGSFLRLEFLSSLHGVTIRRLNVNGDAYKADPLTLYRENYRPHIQASLQNGLPVLAECVDVMLVTGMDEGEPELLGQLSCVTESKIARLQQYPWSAVVLDGTCQTITRHEADKQALQFAVELGRDEVDLLHLPGKHSGLKSWKLWQEQLVDPELAGPHFYNANVRGNLIGNRTAAGAYLRQMTPRHTSRIQSVLQRCIEDYDAIVALLKQTDTSKEGFEQGTSRLQLIKHIDQLMHLESQAHEHLQQASDLM